MKVACINIERSRHLTARVLPFLQQEKPDVLCLQEVCLEDLPLLEDHFGQRVLFAPICRHPHTHLDDPTLVTVGLGLVARQPLTQTAVYFYHGRALPVPLIQMTLVPGTNANYLPEPNSANQAVVVASVGGVRFATTHLVVTAQGESSPLQLAMADRLLAYLGWERQQHPNLLLCGDFNAPRGKPTWARLAEAFTDNIPAAITTTLDGSLHRSGPIPFVVDGIFSSGAVAVTGVQVHGGISDHYALTAEVMPA